MTTFALIQLSSSQVPSKKAKLKESRLQFMDKEPLDTYVVGFHSSLEFARFPGFWSLTDSLHVFCRRKTVGFSRPASAWSRKTITSLTH